MSTAKFSLEGSPFKVLGADYQASASDLGMLVEDAELDGLIDEAVLLTAQQNLVAPRTRLMSEVSWLPELSRLQISKLFELLDHADARSILQAIDHFPELAKANIAAHLCSRNPGSIDAIPILSRTWDEIDPASVLVFLNENRCKANFPNIDIAQLRNSLDELRRAHAAAASLFVWSTSAPGTLMTEVVEREIKINANATFLSQFVRQYDENSERALSDIIEDINETIEVAKSAPDSIREHIEKISNLLSKWDDINQPVQLYEQSRGHEEARSKKVYQNVRDLCLMLANEKGKYAEALELSEALLRTFPELESVAEALKTDIATLESLAEQNELSDQLEPLINACERAKGDLLEIRRTLRIEGFSPRGIGTIGSLVSEYNAARSKLQDPHAAIMIVRGMALDINNEMDDPETAFRLIDGLLGSIGTNDGAKSEIVEKLKLDRSVLHQNWKMSELDIQSGNLSEMAIIVDEMLVYATDEDKSKLQILKTQIQERRTKKAVKVLIYVGIAAVIGFFVLSSEFKSSNKNETYRPITSSSNSVATRPVAPPPVTKNAYDEEAPPIATGQTLDRNQVRYCVFQGARLEYMRPLTINNYQIDRFNALISDFNGRCSSFRYRSGVLQSVEREAVDRRSILEADARRIVSAW